VRISTAQASDYADRLHVGLSHRLTSVTVLNITWTITSNVSYTYDSADRRIMALWSNDNPPARRPPTCHNVYDGSNLYLEMNAPEQPDGPGPLCLRLASLSPTPRRWTRFSPHDNADNGTGTVYWAWGTTRGTVRARGAVQLGTGQTTVLDHRTYDSFGQHDAEATRPSTTSSATLGRYSRRPPVWPTMGVRWYNPATGRYESEDPRPTASPTPTGTPHTTRR